jgi:phospholipid transport system substrate-binding protein
MSSLPSLRRRTLPSLLVALVMEGAALFVLSPIGPSAPVYAAAPPTTGMGPRATLQKLNGDVDKLLRAKTVAGSDEEQRVKNDIKQRASELLDYTELCKRALGEHWGKMPEKQRTEFVATLRDLIERNYVKQLRTNLDYEVKYGEEEISKTETENEARVLTTLKLQTKGKSTTATIEYRLIQHDKQWMVFDVITDELSLVRNYRSTFLRIIGSSGYDGLLSKMKNKLNEERARDTKEEQERAAKKAAGATAAAPSPKN